ncbi:MAG: chemotaxis protein CheB [Calditrichaeota bacterium]|nr:chemotaxis protein CheB [Calditrichota bacterium]
MSRLLDQKFQEMDAAIEKLNSVVNSYCLIAIGSSTGGPKALRTIFEKLPSNFPVPIIVAQHMSRGFMKNLVEHINKICSLRACLAETGMKLEAGAIYFSPDDQHVRVTRKMTLELVQFANGKLYVPSVDVLFESVAESLGKRAIGIILTGMGNDGAAGLRKMADVGAFTIAESEETSVVFGMPKVAIEKGAAREVLPIYEIANRIIELTGLSN